MTLRGGFTKLFLPARARAVAAREVLPARPDIVLLDNMSVDQLRQAVALRNATAPETELEAVLPYLDEVDLVLVMSVHPGFGGQSFISAVLSKTRALRQEHGYKGWIEMDGGLNRDTVASCAEAGCDVFVAGSALYGAGDMAAEIGVFRERIRGIELA